MNQSMESKKQLKSCFASFNELYTPKVLLAVNDCNIMLVKIHGDKVPWHSHDADELFWVVSGSLTIHTREQSVELNAGELYKVSQGVEHRVTSNKLSHIVLLESKDFKHTGSTQSDITKQTLDCLLD